MECTRNQSHGGVFQHRIEQLEIRHQMVASTVRVKVFRVMMIVEQVRRMFQRMQLHDASPPFLTRAGRRLLMLPLMTVLALDLVISYRFRGTMRRETHILSGSKFTCLLPDFVSLYLYLFGIWEPDITEFIRRRLKPGHVFVDVGANIGYHSILASQAVGVQGRVVAIEASPTTFALLKENLSLNPHCENVRAVNMAAAHEVRQLKIYNGSAFGLGLTSTRDHSDRRGHDAVVDAAPLDDLLDDDEWGRIRLIKIDVEGAEPSVIGGMSRLIRTCPPDAEFLIEVTPRLWTGSDKRPEDVLHEFFEAGFLAYRIPNDYLPGRYLYPFRNRRPQRITGPIKSLLGELDLVLSRCDASEL